MTPDGEEHIDSYTVTVCLTREWNNDSAIAKGKWPELPLDKAMLELIKQELGEAVGQEVLSGSFKVTNVHFPDWDALPQNSDCSNLSEELTLIHDILVSDKVSDGSLRNRCWDRLITVIRHRPQAFFKKEVKVNHESAVLSLKEYEEIALDVSEGRKIMAIKKLRIALGCGLVEAKNAVEDASNFPRPSLTPF